MNYISTRDNKVNVSAAKAISLGISADGGLFLPEAIPTLSAEDFEILKVSNYKERARLVLSKFLTDFTEEEITACVEGAYTGSFENESPAPISILGADISVLELWHGPTCAFKDLALQLLPYLLTTSSKKVSAGKTVILVATSGDTGKAALEGFKDVENTDIIVFYPSDGVSSMQKLQMDTQEGKNVCVCAIKGNFDDAQSRVKEIFTDAEMNKKLADAGYNFSSANSINWGRLVPQIVYYVSAYCDMLADGNNGNNEFNVVVPTGNFGNILAAYYAKEMGVPIKKLICASNANNVLTDFINTGVYDRNREFYTTISPSMDILISSNLERMLYMLSGGDDKQVAAWQADLKANGKFTVSEDVKNKITELFWGGCCNDEETLATIKDVYEKYGYLMDTHTAVAFSVYKKYRDTYGDMTPVLIASTASPYKFANSVLSAFDAEIPEDDFAKNDALSVLTATDIPAPIEALKGKARRFGEVIDRDEMKDAICKYLGI
ncbi:MAG: threonine synthase [Clostridia bacterium]|nr:threonine synthase [Clostridia bacterium]